MNLHPTSDRPHVFVGTPCFGGLVTQRYMQSTFNLFQQMQQAGLSLSIELLGYDSLITRSRNALVAKFLDQPTATHLLFIDADIGFDPHSVFRMLALGQEVVAGMYPLKLIDWNTGGLSRALGGEPVETAPLRYVGAPCEGAERRERDGFVTGLYAGTGFMLIARSAFLKMMEAFSHLRYAAAHTQATAETSRNLCALFDCMIDPETGIYLSEDYTFCKRWRGIGGELWLDTQSRLIHVGPHEFHGRPDIRFPLPAAVDTAAAA